MAGGAPFLSVFSTIDINARADDTTPDLTNRLAPHCGCRILRAVCEGCEPLNETPSRTPLRIESPVRHHLQLLSTQAFAGSRIGSRAARSEKGRKERRTLLRSEECGTH